MRVFFLFFLIFSFSICLSQQDEAKIIASTPIRRHDSLFYELFKKYRQSDPTQALSYAEKALNISKLFNDTTLEVKSQNAIGWLQQNAGDYESAIDTHTKALELARKYKMEDREMYSYNNLGIIFDKLDIYDKALENYFRCLELARKNHVQDVEITTLNNIGVSYGKLKNFVESLNYFKEAHELEMKLGQDGLNEIYVNIGLTYIDLDDHEQAKKVFQEMIGKKDNTPPIYIASLRGLSRCYLLDNETQKCIYYAIQARDLAAKNQIRDQQSDSYYLIAAAKFKEGHLESALQNCNMSIDLAKQIRSHSNLNQSFDLQSKIFEKLGDFKKSKEALSLSVAYKDSIFNQSFTENFKNIHLKLEKEKNSSILNAKDRKIAEQELVTLISLVVGIALLIITFILIFFFRINSQKNKVISSYAQDLEKRVNERTERLKNVIAEMDTYIYRTSHDIKGPLATLKGLTELAIHDTKNSMDYLTRLTGVIDKLFDIINRVTLISKIHNHEVSWKEVSLEELFDFAIQAMAKTSNFRSVRIEKRLEVKTIKTDVDILSIAINNIISNVYRYIHNKREPILIIESKSHGNYISISIKDNGVGFDPRIREKAFELFVHGEGDTGAGLGLHLSKLAVEKAGGKISLVEDELTHLQIDVPVME
jgi:signal transduction histidine kinase/Tfp pilus assembly protein PilF